MAEKHGEMSGPSHKKRRTGVGGSHCIAPGCTNYYYKDSSKHYHRLPLKNKTLLKAWLQRLKRKDPPVNEYARVCSDHFVPDQDYHRKGMIMPDGSFNFIKTDKLKADAVPTVFEFSTYNPREPDTPSAAARRSAATATYTPSPTSRGQRHELREAKQTKREVKYIYY